MKSKLLQYRFLAAAGLFVVLGLSVAVFGSQQLSEVLPSRIITVQADVPIVRSQWSILDKITAGQKLLDAVPLRVSSGSIAFTETRYSPSGSMTLKTFSEPERQVALSVLQKSSGQLQVVMVTLHGNQVIAPMPWQIKMVSHPDGITFNYWNTAYQITSPPGYIVVANKFPDVTDTKIYKKVKNSKGKFVTVSAIQRTIKDVIYTPDSPDIEEPALVQAGKDYLASLSYHAAELLRQKRVFSRVSKNSLVVDVPQLPLSFNEHLPLLEQSDYMDFLVDPRATTDRIFVLMGANGSNAWNLTCNKANACGLYQFTQGTWNNLRKTYPAAGLPTFQDGARIHIYSAMAAMLLYDYNLSDLVRQYGSSILSDPNLEEYLAASYNGKPTHVVKSIKAASVLSAMVDWFDALTAQRGGLVSQQREYIAKLRYLKENKVLN